MKPKDYYQQCISEHTNNLHRSRKNRNFITCGKLLTFGAAVFQLYWFITTNSLFFIYPVLTILLFAVLTYLDNQTVRQLQLIGEILRINQNELNYLLENKLEPFPTGQTYSDPTHPYASDLDLFGEDSLFQHLNRTVTAQGTRLLAHWLLHLSKETLIIKRRQQAVAELSELPAWCQQFRGAGQLNPTRDYDSELLRHWEEAPAFFPKPRSIRVWLYTLNCVTILSWILAFSSLFPWSLALSFSFTQLLILTLYLKKINRYHRKLDLFLRTISNYLPLVRLLYQQTFTSTELKDIKNTLSEPAHNAVYALHHLKKIRENLDQRGNILAAFILNGLYLRDIHTLLRLDKWKKEYCRKIVPWLQAISTADALVSMANFRFNHPDYSVPEISITHLLDAVNIGHPLLKKDCKIRNDFHIDRLHQLFIVTGANMAGKSTFLRTIGINLILAQSGNVVDSKTFSFQPMALFTSMRTTDNLAKGTSYFHAELLRLKQLVRTAEKEERLFIILDEMLKGTNSVDKLNGSVAFLRKLLSYPVSGLIATHDLALGELADTLPENFFNVCFEIIHTPKNICYDYKLHPGISSTMNASILLKQMGLI